MSMNIFSKKGDKVVFAHPNAGYELDKELAKEHLVLGAVYVVSWCDAGQSSTRVYLEEVPNKSFNSVHFEDYDDDSVA